MPRRDSIDMRCAGHTARPRCLLSGPWSANKIGPSHSSAAPSSCAAFGRGSHLPMAAQGHAEVAADRRQDRRRERLDGGVSVRGVLPRPVAHQARAESRGTRAPYCVSLRLTVHCRHSRAQRCVTTARCPRATRTCRARTRGRWTAAASAASAARWTSAASAAGKRTPLPRTPCPRPATSRLQRAACSRQKSSLQSRRLKRRTRRQRFLLQWRV